ncbi:hypothetical protein SDC9_210892 [bioreactor metagenome]|uniref:Uncharacterized protein n=1 Tax=bioreactor metagenome TaxID=1076179 RepID=A0A645JHH0_9ZZZZ
MVPLYRHHARRVRQRGAALRERVDCGKAARRIRQLRLKLPQEPLDAGKSGTGDGGPYAVCRSVRCERRGRIRRVWDPRGKHGYFRRETQS